jgi:hypothetical protein
VTGFDLFERLAQTDVGRNLLEEFERTMAARSGTARQAHWQAEDGWYIIYTTTRIKGGPHDGKFVVQAMKPYGKGARSGRKGAQQWVEAYRREFSTRKLARARAEALYRKHSPKYAAEMAEQETRWWVIAADADGVTVEKVGSNPWTLADEVASWAQQEEDRWPEHGLVYMVVRATDAIEAGVER